MLIPSASPSPLIQLPLVFIIPLNVDVPFTSNLAVGLVVPIPTFPPISQELPEAATLLT